MRLIDSDALIKRMPSVMDMQDVYLPIHFKELLIDESPTVDAVPVVRCKDCIWNREKEWVDCYMSGMHGRNVNNFCSQGKRKEE